MSDNKHPVSYNYYVNSSGYSQGTNKDVGDLLDLLFESYAPNAVDSKDARVGDRVQSHMESASMRIDSDGIFHANVVYVVKTNDHIGLKAVSNSLTEADIPDIAKRYRALSQLPIVYIDEEKGSDLNDGSEERPLKSFSEYEARKEKGFYVNHHELCIAGVKPL